MHGWSPLRLSTRLLAVAFALLTIPCHLVSAANFSLVKDYSGKTFFDEWIFDEFPYDETTGGSVFYVNKSASSSLAYVNDANKVIIKVDNTSFVPYYDKRNSVRIASQASFSIGSVLVVDAVHLPFGCSVWPSIWTKGNPWPDNGEIDIIEGINHNPYNQMSLHTFPGCSAATNTTALNQPAITNCNNTGNTGCTVLCTEKRQNTFGKGFADNGGGVWATQFDVSGIFIWFWDRHSIPSSIETATTSLDISSWGSPSAAFPSSSCDITKHFGAQQIVIDITLCGTWAGVPSIYASQCGGNATDPNTCNNNSVWYNGTPELADAYFELNYIRAFSLNGSASVVDSNGSSGSTGSTSAVGPSGSTDAAGQTSGDQMTISLIPYVVHVAILILPFLSCILF
ncbi:concanavalin A-like lectin/glucanase domain-containing protein [Irpex lacteus]|nr:concanavalin A-like lectin/glucanase domain-containing protein [Irpex lacteus]